MYNTRDLNVRNAYNFPFGIHKYQHINNYLPQKVQIIQEKYVKILPILLVRIGLHIKTLTLKRSEREKGENCQDQNFLLILYTLKLQVLENEKYAIKHLPQVISKSEPQNVLHQQNPIFPVPTLFLFPQLWRKWANCAKTHFPKLSTKKWRLKSSFNFQMGTHQLVSKHCFS